MWISKCSLTERANIMYSEMVCNNVTKRPNTNDRVPWTVNKVGIDLIKVSLSMKCFRKSRLWVILKSGHNIEQKINSYNEELKRLIICWSFCKCVCLLFFRNMLKWWSKYIFIFLSNNKHVYQMTIIGNF